MSSNRSHCFRALARWLVIVLFHAGLTAPQLVAGDSASYVPGFESLRNMKMTDDARSDGELLLGELNCAACHSAEAFAEGRIVPKPAPVLTHAGSRIQPGFLRAFLLDPRQVKPGTTMPAMLSSLPAAEREDAAECLVHFLVSIGGSPTDEFPTIGSGMRGDALYHSVGCAACHGARREDTASQPGIVPLPDMSRKYTLGGLTDFLLEPLHVRPGGRMPKLNLTSEQARSVAAFLLGLPEVARVRVAYYEGQWNQLPDFSKLEPVAVAGADRIDVSMAARKDYFGLRFEAFLKIDKEGIYRFHLTSDDGSRLTIDDRVVVDHDGVHAPSHKSGDTKLLPGLHSVVVDFFEYGGGEEIKVEIEGGGLKRQPLENLLTGQREAPKPREEALSIELDPRRVERGRELFATLGCAACHELQEGGMRLAHRGPRGPALDALRFDRGCWSSAEGQRTPRYALTSAQRAAIQAACDDAGKNQKLNPTQIVHRTMARLNCYGCHQRDGMGGVADQVNMLFQTTTPEMGDEGRLPPPLDGVGGKLTHAWLSKTLAEGAKDRPYMPAKMPAFGADNTAELAAALEQCDLLEPLPPLKFTQPLHEVKEAGRLMTGETGFSCIKCHTFGRFPAQGIQSINLQTMHARLREEWFRRYLRNPALFRPGTRMPSAWPPTGKSLLDQFLDGDSDQQIGAIWVYLSDGDRARIPAGLVIPSMELVPVDRAIIYRNFITGGGPRAIGVGYPEQINLAFDANNMRLALLWQGRFIDASRHWSGRGQGFQPPEGENVIELAGGQPFARLDAPDAPWPTATARQSGYRFRGYRLTKDDRPTFLYTMGSLSVEDHVDTLHLGRGAPVPRVLQLQTTQPLDGLWFRAATGKIQEQDEGWYDVDGAYRLRIETDPPTEPLLRSASGHDELLVPINFRDGKARLTEFFSW